MWILFFVSVIAGFLVQTYLLQVKSANKLYPGLRVMRDKENAETYVSEQTSICNKLDKKNKNRYICINSVSKLVVDQVPFKTIVKALGNSGRDCHDLMHNVVSAEYRKGAKLPEIWGQCTSACFGACYHGGLEGLLGQSEFASKNDEEINKSLINICGSINAEFSNLSYQCFHGIGHALMLFHEGDLEKSLLGCDKVPGETGQTNCFGGVFMENLPNSTTTDHITKRFIKEDNPLYPCDSIDKHYQQVCYSFQITHFFNISNRELPKVIKLCEKIPSEYINLCFNQIGLMHINGLSSDQSRVMKICDSLPSGKSQQSCIEGVIMGYNDRFPRNFAEMKRKGIFKFCEDVRTPYKSSCYSKIGRTISSILPDKNNIETECENVKELQYKINCQTGEI